MADRLTQEEKRGTALKRISHGESCFRSSLGHLNSSGDWDIEKEIEAVGRLAELVRWRLERRLTDARKLEEGSIPHLRLSIERAEAELEKAGIDMAEPIKKLHALLDEHRDATSAHTRTEDGGV